jgi:hypothetical protein
VVIVAETPKNCYSLVDIHCYYYQNQKKKAWKRGGSLSFLVGTISNVLVMEIDWTDVGSGDIS